mmetsp:Transcript_77693/g.218048  ORF Transcript_77693/g.218048 Transcript_77693/m.218048 type:complete len:278 (+) Transcript_77693:220-1053(+)
MRTAPFTAAAAGHVSSDETKLCKTSLLCGVFQPPWEVRHLALPHRHQSSLVDQLQTKAEILATHLQVLAPIHVQGDLVHRPLGEVALEWPLPDGPHKQAKLDPNPLSASIQLQPQCTIERRARLTFPGLRSKAHVAALTGSPSLARQEVHAEVVATSDLQWRKDHGAPATAPQFLEHALDTPLGARLLVISLPLRFVARVHTNTGQLLERVRKARRWPKCGEEDAGWRRRNRRCHEDARWCRGRRWSLEDARRCRRRQAWRGHQTGRRPRRRGAERI